MARESLGEFEQMVLLAILRLGDDAYGVPIVEEIEGRTNRTVSRPAVYIALRRLSKKRLVSSELAEPTAEQGGRAKTYYRVEKAGLDLLAESRRDLLNMWKGLSPVLDNR